MKGNLRLAPLLIGLALIAGYMLYGCREGPFGRRQVVTLSPADEARLGAQAFREVLQKSDVVDRGPVVDAVRQIGMRLARAAEDPKLRGQMHLQAMSFDWDFRVVRSEQVNAFCLPGGKVVVYTGILPVCQTDAGLATVMGHEIGHALARHGAERMAQQQMVQIGQVAAAYSLGDMDVRSRRLVVAAMGLGTQVGVLLPFSRSHESEADHIGLLLMAGAGYDPAEAPEFWQRMQRATGSRGRPTEFLSTHPAPETRIRDLRRELPEAEKIYDRSEHVRSRPLPQR